MTKADLVERVADSVGPQVTKKDCGLAVDAFLAALKEALARGERIEIRGFGTFKVRHRKARTGRNPRTGQAVEVPPRAVPVFQPSRHFRRRVDRRCPGSGRAGERRLLNPFASALMADRLTVMAAARVTPTERPSQSPPPCWNNCLRPI